MKNNNDVNTAESRIKDEEAAKHTIKDSVFTDLFQDQKYLIQLYRTLHPEDQDTTEEQLSDITKVLYGSDKGDIISQYVTFTKVYDEQRKQHGRTRKAVTETIRICKDKNVLKEYLEEREKEVVNIMLAMYDEKEILLEYIESERYEAAQEAAKEADKRTVIQMLKTGKLSVEEIAQYVPSLSVEDIEKIRHELLQDV